MLTGQTKNHNTYCIDISSKYLSLIHPLMEKCINADSKFFSLHYDNNDVQYYMNKIKFLIKYGLNKKAEINKFGRILPRHIEEQIVNIRQITFEVTDACNLKCKYCGYGDLYEDFEPRGKKFLNFEEIYPFLSYLIEIWNNKNSQSYNLPISISFYGGEPLLNIKFIKKVVHFFESVKIKNRLFIFEMTSNAVLIYKNLDFLYKHKFKILISLDGNEFNHSYRVNHSGVNSFNSVIKNIDKIKKKYPDYFENYINFNSVLHNKNSVFEIYNFIHSLYNKIPMISELKNYGVKKEKIHFFNQLYQSFSGSISKFSENKSLENNLFLNSPTIMSLGIFLKQYTLFIPGNYLDLLYKIQHTYLPTGTCFPFSKKIFITVNKKILPCERINQKFSLGNINDKKIDFTNIASKYNRLFDNLEQQCSVCYRSNSCIQCMYNIKDIESKPKCSSFFNKEHFIEYFISNVSLLEEIPEMFNRVIKEASFT